MSSIGLRVRDGFYWVEQSFVTRAGKSRRVQQSTHVREGSPEQEQEAQRQAQRIMAKYAHETEKSVETATVADAFQANVDAKTLKECAPASFEIVAEKRVPVEKFFGALTLLAAITDDRLKAYALDAKRAGKARATIKRELKELAYGMRKLGYKPILPELGKSAVGERTLDIAETRALFANVPANRIDHVKMYRLAGLRFAELYNIAPKDVNLARNTLRIREGESESVESSRTIPMHPEVAQILARRIAGWKRGTRLFEPWLTGNALRDLKLYCSKADIDPCCFNDLRRSFATELAMAGESNMKVAALLGHTSTRMVDAVYARIGGRSAELTSSIAKLASYEVSGKAGNV